MPRGGGRARCGGARNPRALDRGGDRLDECRLDHGLGDSRAARRGERRVGVLHHVPGGIGQSWCRIRADNLPPFTVEYLPYFAGKTVHGGRGGAFELLSRGHVIVSDQEGGRPGGPVCSVSNTPYPGPQDVVYRFRSDLWAPPGHEVGVLFRLVPE